MNFLLYTKQSLAYNHVSESSIMWVQFRGQGMSWERFCEQADREVWTSELDSKAREHAYRTTPPDERFTPEYYQRIEQSLPPVVRIGITIFGDDWIMEWVQDEFSNDARWRFTSLALVKPTEVLNSIFL